MPVRDIHSQSLATSTAISLYYMRDYIPPLEVIKVLNEAGVRFVLVGAHGLGGWMNKSRATEDVDVIVAARGFKRAVRALAAAFPEFRVEDLEVVTRFRNPETNKVRIDVMKPNQDVIKAALKNTHVVKTEGQVYCIPSLEMALALKFAPMTSLNRADLDKHQDAHDFIAIIRANPEIDLEKLAELGQLVYNGGGAEILEHVRRVRAGEKLII